MCARAEVSRARCGIYNIPDKVSSPASAEQEANKTHFHARGPQEGHLWRRAEYRRVCSARTDISPRVRLLDRFTRESMQLRALVNLLPLFFFFLPPFSLLSLYTHFLSPPPSLTQTTFQSQRGS